MNSENLPIVFRKHNEHDLPFIYSSWLKSYRKSNFGYKISNTIYFSEHHKIIEKLLKNSIIIVACPEDDVANVIGYIVASEVDGIRCFHYLYVKQSFRSLGIATMLLKAFNHTKELLSIYTHHTRPMDLLAEKLNMVHHPYIALTDSYIQSDKVKDIIESAINNGRLQRRKPGRPKKSKLKPEDIKPSSEDTNLEVSNSTTKED